MNRKKFIINTALVCGGNLVFPILAGCSNPTEPKPEKIQSDIVFSNGDSVSGVTGKISSSGDVLKSAVLNKKPVSISAESNVITITPEDSKVKLSKSDGEEVYIRFGTIRTSPSIILERTSGGIIAESSIVPDGMGNWSAEEWLGKAVLVLSGALAVWLGATVVKLLAAAVAYVAVNILILSVIVAAVSILAWLLEKTGWSFNGLLELLKNSTDWIKELLLNIVN
ncbi:MAG: hypothetical protein FMNOHCHN_03523 [Ignavibacteriaceae bacterium]|nr:hypothetical protein [Ignavibacteriaceae bacterium]